MAMIEAETRKASGEVLPGVQRSALNLAAARVAANLRHRPVSVAFLAAFLRFIDFSTLFAIGALIHVFYVVPNVGNYALHYYLPLVVLPALTVSLIGTFKGYNLDAYRRPLGYVGKAAGLWAAVFGVFSLVLFFFRAGEDFSRLWLAVWFICGFCMLGIARLMLARLVREWTRNGLLERRAVLVGGGPEAVSLIHALDAEPDNDIRICGIFDDRDGERAPAVQEGFPRLGRIDELVEFGRRAQIDLLIVALPLTAERRLLELMKQLWVLPVDIRLAANTTRLRFRPRSYSFIGSVPFLDLFDKPIAGWDSVVKRLFDMTIASLALILLSPVLLAVAIAVKLDSRGPVFFRQHRYGFNNELIGVFKFRSMYTEMTDANAARLVTRDDPRITRVGRFIRRTSLDELPQLVNVLKGDLSLVGPRPHALQAKAADQLYEQVVDGYFARHRVKPGITGWAQVNGWRGETDTQEKLERRVEYDQFYIENWSVLFDLYILFLTPFRLFNDEAAY
ncbi:undecaprenyl-phosphate glucose phosphotransferase [Afifella sp. IM 167]|uniref:undecaprenyl-phosphate glucose phosphotransferase n=1 Tax=Afifella sp. IM 167 TaxID=2033586 RepID=UPI001CCC53F2|nr:undecaprenyl-phosphate glucose phosphotransferase [Afifella sp. IM 167]MBZ8132510.1 undecaprenyl-phosphate glucose phosphotransferase [Afifella sp. IM 167]